MKNELLVHSDDKEYRLKLDPEDSDNVEIDGKNHNIDLVKTPSGFHLISDQKGYNIEVIKIDREKKSVELKINSKYYAFSVKDKYDELLEQLGMDLSSAGKVSEIKAPMPGLVLEVLVKPGEVVNEDQPLLILEAMKMENVIKSPAESTVKKVGIKEGDSVEKNQILIEFD